MKIRVHKCRFCGPLPNASYAEAHWIITWPDGESQWASSWRAAGEMVARLFPSTS